MKIAFTSREPSWESQIDPRFGRTSYLAVYSDDTDEMSFYDNRDIENEAHGAGPKTAQKLFEYHPDVLITGNGPGSNAASVLEKAGIDIYRADDEMTVQEAYKAFKENKLSKF